MKKTKAGTQAMESNKPKRVTIADIWPFAGLVRNITSHKQFEETLPRLTKPIAEPQELLGIEIEVENILNPVAFGYYWKDKQDGSLRNYGMEYASIPLKAYQVEYALTYFNQVMLGYNKPDYSPRTSVHVHINVRNMTVEEIKVMTILYAIFERYFFSFTTLDRIKSIFCVPLYKTGLLEGLSSFEEHQSWSKYSALNLCTIFGGDGVGRYGTIEFRHMHGTNDVDLLISWINNILCLKAAAYKYTLDNIKDMLLTMNTTSSYWALFTKIFGDFAIPHQLNKKDFELCITNLKLSLYGNEFFDKYGYTQTSLARTKYDAYNRLPRFSTKVAMPPQMANQEVGQEVPVNGFGPPIFNPQQYADAINTLQQAQAIYTQINIQNEDGLNNYLATLDTPEQP